jgi:hypothetical protein
MARITCQYVQLSQRNFIKFDIYSFRDALTGITMYILYFCITTYMAKRFVCFCLIL